MKILDAENKEMHFDGRLAFNINACVMLYLGLARIKAQASGKDQCS